MRNKDSRNFVSVQVMWLHDQDFTGPNERHRKTTLHAPASAVERLVEKRIISYDERCNPPFIMDPSFDDVALAIPGAFITRS